MLLSGVIMTAEMHPAFEGGFPEPQNKNCPYHRTKYFDRFYYPHLSQEATESSSNDTALLSELDHL